MATQALTIGGQTGNPAPAPLRPSATGSIVEMRPRLELAGVRVDRVDLSGALSHIRRFVRSGRPHQVVTVNLDFLALAERDAAFRETLNGADLAVADGMPLVWASRMAETPLPERVAGVELVSACCQLAAELDQAVVLLGAGPGVAERAAGVLQERYPGLRVTAYAPPMGPLTPDEDARIVRRINAVQPAFLFVALGAPRQDLWIRTHLRELRTAVAMGVGCTLDVLAGQVSRAPRWMQQAGLEWAYRLGQEPSRLWRRYLLRDLPTFARLMLTLPARDEAYDPPAVVPSQVARASA